VKARIVPNLVEVIDEYFGGKGDHRTDPAFLALADRIAGQVVDLRFIGFDAFEVQDNNYWLPECCWQPLEARGNGE
jgi:hypothetical protein